MKSLTHDPIGNQEGCPLVRVIITDQHTAVAEPALPELLPLLTVPASRFETADDGGLRRVTTTSNLFDHDVKGRIVFPAGLLPRCVAELKRRGYQVEIDDQRQYGPRFATDPTVLDEADIGDRPVLEAVIRQPLGLFEVCGDKHTVLLMAAIIHMYPRARFVVGLSSKRLVGKVSRMLTAVLGEEVGYAYAERRLIKDRCTVCTYDYLRTVAKEPDQYILLLPKAERATGDAVQLQLGGLPVARRYGFASQQTKRDWRQELLLEAVCGPVLVSAAKPKPAVRVMLVPTPRSHIALDDNTALGRKRVAYWHNEQRNRRIAEVAAAVAAGDEGQLTRLGMQADSRDRESAFGSGRVVVLVESTEHARQLQGLLPGWVVQDTVSENSVEVVPGKITLGGQPLKKEGKHRTPSTGQGGRTIENTTGSGGVPRIGGAGTAEIREAAAIRVNVGNGPAAGVQAGRAGIIITAMRASVDGIDADIIIRATGTGWPLNETFLTQVKEAGPATREIVLIDFDDDFDRQARQDTERRLRDYARRGWTTAPYRTRRRPEGEPGGCGQDTKQPAKARTEQRATDRGQYGQSRNKQIASSKSPLTMVGDPVMGSGAGPDLASSPAAGEHTGPVPTGGGR